MSFFMPTTRTLPPYYRKVGTLDVSRNERLILLLNLGGLLIMILAGWLFFRAIAWLRSEDITAALRPLFTRTPAAVISLVAAILALFVFHILAHEAIHGIFFWIFTRSRPRFAFKWAYAYAAAPEWYIPRDLFFVTTLAPFAFITLAGLLLIAFAPAAWLLPTWFVISMNAGGAVGDLAVAAWLLRQPPTCLAQDCGDAVTLFIPE
jgi:hypothetical protein